MSERGTERYLVVVVDGDLGLVDAVREVRDEAPRRGRPVPADLRTTGPTSTSPTTGLVSTPGSAGESSRTATPPPRTAPGWGMSIVREVIEAYGWSVALGDSESSGARFEFTGVDAG